MKFGKTASIFFIFITLVYFLTGIGAKSQKIVRLAGSTAFLPFAEKLAEHYMKTNKDITVDVQGGGSAVGIMVATEGIVDIGMADMLSLPKETDSLEKVVVARDGIAIIVNLGNPLTNLTLNDLTQVFSGKVKEWKEIGVNLSGQIRVISREEGSGTRKSFDQLILKSARLTTDAMFQDSNGTIREAVKSDPNSIGYISIGFLDSTVKAISVNGIVASNENVILDTYKISRPVYFLFKQNPTPETKNFIQFILGKEAQKIIAADGLIPVVKI
ncbi:phosphate ABC transporter substrate-binding protein [Candidatus Microgenomates bacterium]|nr:phosphate ABC transporter substrate-binding protein [Candidatus Microgenomates bacterium]